MDIPASVEELTPAWFSEALDTDVTAVDVLDAHTGTTGRAKVRLASAGAVPDTLFVKLQPFGDEQRELVRMMGMGVAEAKLYALAADELPVRLPKVWHASYDENDASFVMVLEDLEASGCRFATADDPDALAIAQSLVDELAVLHATYWGKDVPWLAPLAPRSAPSEKSSGAAPKRPRGGAPFIQSALEQFEGEMPPEFGQLCRLYVDRYRDIGALWVQGEQTLIHGDTHIGNLFVDEGRTGFYDWAVACRQPGMRDVAYFLCNSLPTEVRRAEADALIARYLDGLAGRGVVVSPELAQEQYRLFSIYAWMGAATTSSVGSRWQTIEVGRTALDRTTQAIIDLDVLGLLAERLG